MNSYYIYLHCKPDGTPFYVGKGCNGLGHSKRSHDLKRSRNAHHRAVVEKYGAENIGIFVFHCESEDQALADEILTIRQLRSEGFKLANATDGGEGSCGLRPSAETRAKMSAKRKGVKRSPETIAKMKAAGICFKPGDKGFAGKSHTPEHRASLVGNKLALGYRHDEVSRQKMRDAHARRRRRALEELNPMGGDAALLPKPTNVPSNAAPKEDQDAEPDLQPA